MNAHLAHGQYDDLLRESNKVIPVLQKKGHQKSAANMMNVAAAARLKNKQPGMALKVATEAMKLYETMGDKDGEMASLSTIVQANFERTDTEHVERSLAEMVKGFEDAGDKKKAAAALSMIAKIWLSKKHVDKAIKSGERSVALYKELGDLD